MACYLRNRPKRAAVEMLLRDGHVGYLLKKMRQVMGGKNLLKEGNGCVGWVGGWMSMSVCVGVCQEKETTGSANRQLTRPSVPFSPPPFWYIPPPTPPT